MTNADREPIRTQVLIVGGGPVGLTASTLLSMQGIENVVLERRAETQRAPAAHVLRPRPIKVFERMGVASAIERAKPQLSLDYITWCTAFAGRDIGKIDLRGDGEPWTNCPQNVLEPILLERAKRESAARILYGAECTAIEQEADTVRTFVDVDGDRCIYEANWLIAADGAGSPVRHMLEIPMVGPGAQGRFFMIHFEADLRPYMIDREGPIYMVMNPATPGAFIVHDPRTSTVLMTPCFGQEGEEENLPARLRVALGAEIERRILSIDTWSPFVQVAERYSEGRVFLAGDAAHRFPPTGGLGLNTGILDVDFLVHRLSQVESGDAPHAILDEYEVECRPVAQTNAQDSFDNMKRMAEIVAAIGPFADLDGLHARLDALTDPERESLARAVENQRSHYTSHGMLPRDPRQTVSA